MDSIQTVQVTLKHLQSPRPLRSQYRAEDRIHTARSPAGTS